MTQSNPMGTRLSLCLAFLAALPLSGPVAWCFEAQSLVKEDFAIYERAPRLLLTERRSRLLRRERERGSIRWQQLDRLVAGKARFEEPGFAFALHYSVSGEEPMGRMAVEWALAQQNYPSADSLRQLALVYDWCQPLLSAGEKDKLAASLADGVRRYAEPKSAAEARSAAFAAIDLADRDPELSRSTLLRLATKWWRGQLAPQLNQGKTPPGWRSELYALFEFLHAIRDNTRLDLDEDASAFFKKLPSLTLLMYYPEPYPGEGNEYRIPVYTGTGEPDLREAAISRAADFALVAYSPNDQLTQFVQGWLIHDRFVLRTTYGAPYEFLWANPYHPGLSYFNMPTVLNFGGNLLVRSGWEDEASWLGYTQAGLQYYIGGKRTAIEYKEGAAPLTLGQSEVIFARPPMATSSGEECENIFVVGLTPGAVYEVEVDDEEMRKTKADAGGVLSLHFAQPRKAGIYVREAHRPAAGPAIIENRQPTR
jgi:hypothetical protein